MGLTLVVSMSHPSGYIVNCHDSVMSPEFGSSLEEMTWDHSHVGTPLQECKKKKKWFGWQIKAGA